jgi:hypothetical protein
MNSIDESVSLYETISAIYNRKNPVSRLLYSAKLKEVSGKDDKAVRDIILDGFKKELQNILKLNGEQSNVMIMFLGTQHVLVAIEVQNYLIRIRVII